MNVTPGGEREGRTERDKARGAMHGRYSQCAGSLGRHLPRSHQYPRGDDIWGSRRSSTALPLRPVKGTDVRHKFNPQTCWDAEKLSSGKASPTSRTSAGSRTACQKKL